MTRVLPLLISALLAGCIGDETVASYGAGKSVWQLTEIDGRTYPAKATLRFDEGGTISGNAPCNRYSGKMEAPFPWFEAKALTLTRRACPDLAAETAFFDALSAMTLSEVSGDTLVLSTPDGRGMVFVRSQP